MARDLYIDGRILVSGARGHLNLGNPVSLTQSILRTVIPNIPALAVLPYIFRNGLTEIVGSPSIVELGGTLLRNTTINGTGFELQFNTTTLSNNTVDYQIDTTNYSLKTSEIFSIQNNVFDADCGLDFYLESQLDLPMTIDGNSPIDADGSKMTIEGLIGDNNISSGYFNIVDDSCTPYSTMQQSFNDSVTGVSGLSSITTNGGVEIKYENNDGIADIATSINLEGSVAIQAADNNSSLFQRIVVTNDEAPTFSGINDVTTDPYSYTFPNITPNNGDIIIADGNGKLQYKPHEIHVQAMNIITGVVGQKAYFHIPFIEKHVCTRINYISTSTLGGNITVEIIDEHNASVLDSLVSTVSNSIANWGGYVDTTSPAISVDQNRLWSVAITANTQVSPATALYLTLTFVPELV